jgi:hypothetical protein
MLQYTISNCEVRCLFSIAVDNIAGSQSAIKRRIGAGITVRIFPNKVLPATAPAGLFRKGGYALFNPS